VWFKHRAWIPVAWSLSLLNLAAVWFAARPGETWHATAHAALAVFCAVGAQHLASRKKPAADPDVSGRLRELEARLLGDPEQAQQVEGRLAELEERLDFAERALVEVRNRAQQPPNK
jgi:hypothetical protein